MKSSQPPSRILTHYFGLMAFLACQRELDPSNVIAALRRFTSESSQWRDGLKFIEVCRLLIIHHPKSSDTIVDVLGKIPAKSLDILDRAECLIRMVHIVRDNEEERDRFLSSKPFSPSRDDAESEMSTVISEDPGIGDDVVSLRRNRDLRRDRCGICDDAWAIFTHEEVVLPFTLQYVSTAAGSDPSAMFSIELSFSVSENHEPFKVVSIPYLAQPVEAVTVQGFPFKYDIELRLRPIHPIPTTFSVFAVYTDQRGKSHKTELEPFKVALQDMFTAVAKDDCVNIWNSKWSKENAFAKLLSFSRDRLTEVLSLRLGPFLVPDDMVTLLPEVPSEFDFHHELLLHGRSADSDDEVKERAVLIHLPPSYHLMMRFVMGIDSCVVWIATDRLDILSLLDSFFASWTAP